MTQSPADRSIRIDPPGSIEGRGGQKRLDYDDLAARRGQELSQRAFANLLRDLHSQDPLRQLGFLSHDHLLVVSRYRALSRREGDLFLQQEPYRGLAVGAGWISGRDSARASPES